MLAECLSGLEEYEGAIEALQHALELKPKDVKLLMQLAKLHKTVHSYEVRLSTTKTLFIVSSIQDALDFYTKALRCSGNSLHCVLEAGEFLFQLGQLQQAEATLKKAPLDGKVPSEMVLSVDMLVLLISQLCTLNLALDWRPLLKSTRRMEMKTSSC